MEVPTVKTLLTYVDHPNTKSVLCEFLTEDGSKYGAIELQQEVYYRNPFEFEGHSEISLREDGGYAITYYENDIQVKLINVSIAHVLEFSGKIFELKETAYDMKEYDY